MSPDCHESITNMTGFMGFWEPEVDSDMEKPLHCHFTVSHIP